MLWDGIILIFEGNSFIRSDGLFQMGYLKPIRIWTGPTSTSFGMQNLGIKSIPQTMKLVISLFILAKYNFALFGLDSHFLKIHFLFSKLFSIKIYNFYQFSIIYSSTFIKFYKNLILAKRYMTLCVCVYIYITHQIKSYIL